MASNTEGNTEDTVASTQPPVLGDGAENATVQADQVPEQQSNAEAPQDDGEATAPTGVTVCGVCKTNPSKYKCSRCYLPYCSVACNKAHRENHPPDPEPKPEPKPQLISQPTPENASVRPTDPRNPFRALESSDKLKLLFARYPSLPDQLLQIHAATLPPAENSEKRGIPSSLQQSGSKKHNWNHDVGIKNGKAALRRARKAGGQEGDAIREYSELVLHILNEGGAQDDVTEVLRQQMAEEDTKLIERLMAEEKR